jgi:hypothetical protein
MVRRHAARTSGCLERRAIPTVHCTHWNLRVEAGLSGCTLEEDKIMDGIIYLVGLIVIVMFILSFFGLR